jgi:hypothetical protein
LIDNIDGLDASDRFLKLKAMVDLLTETAQRNSEKAALAKVTSDAVNTFLNLKYTSFYLQLTWIKNK